jgi:hypothetical protein
MENTMPKLTKKYLQNFKMASLKAENFQNMQPEVLITRMGKFDSTKLVSVLEC